MQKQVVRTTRANILHEESQLAAPLLERMEPSIHTRPAVSAATRQTCLMLGFGITCVLVFMLLHALSADSRAEWPWLLLLSLIHI